MKFAGTFAFQQWYKSTEVLQVECVISTGCVVSVPYDGAVQTFLVRRRNASKLTQTAIARNITLSLQHHSHLLLQYCYCLHKQSSGVSGLVVRLSGCSFESHCGTFASNLGQVANLRCAQVNLASYPSRDGK